MLHILLTYCHAVSSHHAMVNCDHRPWKHSSHHHTTTTRLSCWCYDVMLTIPNSAAEINIKDRVTFLQSSIAESSWLNLMWSSSVVGLQPHAPTCCEHSEMLFRRTMVVASWLFFLLAHTSLVMSTWIHYKTLILCGCLKIDLSMSLCHCKPEKYVSSPMTAKDLFDVRRHRDWKCMRLPTWKKMTFTPHDAKFSNQGCVRIKSRLCETRDGLMSWWNDAVRAAKASRLLSLHFVDGEKEKKGTWRARRGEWIVMSWATSFSIDSLTWALLNGYTTADHLICKSWRFFFFIPSYTATEVTWQLFYHFHLPFQRIIRTLLVIIHKNRMLFFFFTQPLLEKERRCGKEGGEIKGIIPNEW